MFACDVRLGLDSETAPSARIAVTATAFTISEVGREPITLTPEEVVSIEIKGWIPLITKSIVVRHVAFNKIGDVVLVPLQMSCRTVLDGIRTGGFIPKAEPAVEWIPGQPPPWVKLGEEDDEAAK